MVDQEITDFMQNMKPDLIKRRMLSISEKIELIKLLENSSKRKKDIASKFGIPVNTVCSIYANRERILQQSQTGFTNLNCKRIRASSYPDVEQRLLDWYIKNYASKTDGHVSCQALRMMALQVAKSLGHDNFSASNGWIERFKVRHNLKFRKNKNKKSISNNTSTFDNNVSFDSNKSDISQNGNSSEMESFYHVKSNLVWENVSNPVMELIEVKQEQYESYSSAYDSQNSVLPNGIDDNHNNTPPLSDVPETRLTGTDSCDNFSPKIFKVCSVQHPKATITIQDVEESYNVIHDYIDNCRGNVNERTLEAMKELKKFISSEKDKKAQTKITDYFSLL